MDELAQLRIEKIIEMIDIIENDFKLYSNDEFSETSLFGRATLFYIEQIGESMNILGRKLKKNYPEIPWDYSYATRIIIAHHYEKVDMKQIEYIAKNDLPKLRTQLEELLKIDV